MAKQCCVNYRNKNEWVQLNMNIKQHSNRLSGFTLIELMIVVVVIALLSAIAIPSYTSYMLKSRRIDGVSFLTEVASEQIRFSSENNRFATTMAELGYGDAATADSEEGFYTVSIATSNGNQSYVLTATPLANGPQAKDTECGVLTLNSSKQKTVSGTATPTDCW